MSDTRKITVTGGAAVFSVDGDGSSRAAKTRRKRTSATAAAAAPQSIVKVGGDMQQQQQPQKQRESQAESTKAITVLQTPQELLTQDAPAPQSSKVILGGKKPKHMKVILTKKNNDSSTHAPAQSKARKVSLGITHLKRRVTRARRLNKLSKTAPLEQIKKELVAAHIIKEDSKAPESILRQMYADAKLLTSKSL